MQCNYFSLYPNNLFPKLLKNELDAVIVTRSSCNSSNDKPFHYKTSFSPKI